MSPGAAMWHAKFFWAFFWSSTFFSPNFVNVMAFNLCVWCNHWREKFRGPKKEGKNEGKKLRRQKEMKEKYKGPKKKGKIFWG